MKLINRRFPWRIYLRFVFWQTLILSLAFAGFLTFFDLFGVRDLWLCFLIGAVFVLIFSLIVGRRFFLPLGRLIEKSRSLLARRESHSAADKEEWSELEQVFDRMQSDLSQTSDYLSRGRSEIQTLMSAISDAILAVNEHGEALFFNSQFAHQFIPDQTSERFRLGEAFRSPDVLESFQRALKTSEAVQEEIALQPRGGGESRDFQISVAPLRTGSGQVYGALGIFHDVTDLKRAERIRIEFVANASHELRTPLTSIKGYVQTVLQDLKSGRMSGTEKFIEIIARNVDRLIGLVDDLLKLSSLESESKITKQLLSTRELTANVIKNLEPGWKPKNDEVIIETEVEQVMADLDTVEQVIINLVQNAIKYTPERSRIEILWRTAPQGSVQLVVRDNGPGIAAKHLPRLFERFYRVDEARSRAQGGTGLGLAIVKHIMLRHGGTVKVSSELGRGTEFVCEFPAA